VDITKTKSEGESHVRIPADEIKGEGEIFVDHYFANEGATINITLGDDRLPIGLWKSIEHMRKGEKARIMIKPKWGYNCQKNKNIVFFPRGWTDPEKK